MNINHPYDYRGRSLSVSDVVGVYADTEMKRAAIGLISSAMRHLSLYQFGLMMRK